MYNKRVLLFCFPFAGGTAEFYNNLEKACGDSIQFVKLEYSGHGARMKEPLCHSFDEVTNDLFPQIVKKLDVTPNADYSLMGYSMGSIALFDVLKRISEKEEIKSPKSVFLSAHQPQPIKSLRNVPAEGIDEWVKDRTIEFGGVDKKLLNNRIFWRVYLPIFKSDYQMIADYDFDKSDFRTGVPATIFYSEEDTPYAEMKEWSKYFVRKCDFVEYTGYHFFIDEYFQDMANIILKNTIH